LRVINNKNTDPHFNLALEEYLFKESDEEIFMLWQNHSSVIIGKNQNALAEVDINKAQKSGVDIVRRETGGGAVYHDIGNVNYTFISNDADRFMDFKVFAEPVFKTLMNLGIKAELSGRNDFVIGDRKFSGNAQSLYRNRILHHGTLLFDSDLNALSDFLTVDEKKISSKGISSVKSRVTNILPHLKKKISVEEFKNMLLNAITETANNCISELTVEEIFLANKLKNEKYDTWEWNFGSTPPYSFHNKIHTSAGIIEVFLNVDDGIITDIKIYGDFFGKVEVKEFEQKLKGLKHSRSIIESFIKDIDVKKYFGAVDNVDIVNCLF